MPLMSNGAYFRRYIYGSYYERIFLDSNTLKLMLVYCTNMYIWPTFRTFFYIENKCATLLLGLSADVWVKVLNEASVPNFYRCLVRVCTALYSTLETLGIVRSTQW